ncbi:putative ribonuclease H-like domain-containing protein, partial [Tanacetum coccineum]
PKVVLNAVKGNHVNAVKVSACWVWKPKTKGNPQQDLEEKGVIDSGCSRNMTGNMSYLIDFEEIDGGYAAFGGNPKGGKNHRKRFSWVLFLATKVETSGILKSFITGVENLIDQRVKEIRCDNGTKFKNKDMNQFCERKGIKREFSVARTPQQNRVAERKNRTLIEAARTMLADSKIPNTFWAEIGVSTWPKIYSGYHCDADPPFLKVQEVHSVAGFKNLQKDDEKKIEEEVYVCQPPGFEDSDFPDRLYKVEKTLYGLHQAPRAWYETLSTYLFDSGFQRGKIEKTLFIRRDKASTPMETQKYLLKDEDGKEYKKQTVGANSTTEAEYVAASSCCGQVLWIQNQLLDYGDCNEKKLIHMVKIHTDKNVADLLTKAFDNGIGVNSKLMLLGINLLLLGKVNAARHKLTTAVEIVFLAKPAESEAFEQVVNFLNAHTIKYALTVNPTIYTSCIEQFWATVKVKTINEEQQLQALMDGKRIVITKASVRRDLQLDDEEGTDCLPNATIFEELQN